MTFFSTGTPPRRWDLDLSIFSIMIAFSIGWMRLGLIAEGGAYELATVVALFTLVGLMFRWVPRNTLRLNWHLVVLVLFAALRELDFDKRFGEIGVLKSKLYVSEGLWIEKAVGLTVIILVLICFYRLASYNGPAFLRALRRFDGWSWAILSAFVSVFIAKTIDGLARKLYPFGIDVSDWVSTLAINAEELLELSFAGLLILSLALWSRAAQR